MAVRTVDRKTCVRGEKTGMDLTVEFMERALEDLKKEIFSTLHVAMPGIIRSYDSSRGVANIQPGLRRKKADGDILMAPLLQNVPVFIPAEDYNVSPGDICLVVFSDFCADGFIKTGQPVLPPSPRGHDLADGFAFVGFHLSTQTDE